MAYKCPRCNGPKGQKATEFCRSCRVEVDRIIRTKPCEICGKTVQIYAHNKCRICYNTWYNQQHPEKHAAHERARRERHPERVREQEIARGQTGKRKEWRNSYNPIYHEAHKEHLREQSRIYGRTHPEIRNEGKRRRRAVVKGLPATLTLEQWGFILKQHDYSCAYCGVKDVKFQKEHKIPASRGGGYTAENIVPACATCNLRKQRKTDIEFREYLEKYPRVAGK